MEWISVKDEKPDPFDEVLFYTELKTIHEGFMTDKGVVFLYVEYANARSVTHWMKKPEPPKEE